MSIRKSSIQEAIIEAREIENSALAKARKALEEELAPKIQEVANEALKQLEKESLAESMSIEIPDNAELTIKMPNGEATAVDVTDVASADGENTEDDMTDIVDVDSEEMPNDEPINNEDDMEDIFEIEDMFEDEVPAPAEAPAAAPAPAEAPVADAPLAEVPAEMPADAPAEDATIESVNQKLDDVLAKLDTLSGSEGEGSADTEGEVAIIDDEQPAADAAAPAAPAAPAPAPIADPEVALQEDEYELEDDGMQDDEVVYEMEDDEIDGAEEEVVYELEEAEEDFDANSMLEIFNELQQLDELEIVDENTEEETIDEDSQNLRRRASQRKKIGKMPVTKNAPHSDASLKESIEKIKTQYGSKFDELTKENESLKQTIKEYKESFVVLRKQINEVQIFNAKLAYANKLFANGGLTNDEKSRIAEEFDKVETIEEAKKIYNSLLSEMKVTKSPKNSPAEKLRSANPAVAKSSNSTAHTLMESDEIRRMKRLAGI